MWETMVYHRTYKRLRGGWNRTHPGLWLHTNPINPTHRLGRVPSILPHLVAPVLFALAFLPAQRKRILLWSPMALAPDLDYFFAKDYHRALLSNIWIPLAVLVALVILWRRRDPEARFMEFAFRPGAPGRLALSFYFLASHILMDVFAGGVVLLWPLTQVNFDLFFNIVVDTQTNQPVVTAEGSAEPGIPQITPRFEWWSTIDTAVATFLGAATASWLSWRWWSRRGQPKPVVIHHESISAGSED